MQMQTTTATKDDDDFDDNHHYHHHHCKTQDSADAEEDASDRSAFDIGRGNLRIPRQDLRQMLLGLLQPNTVVWGQNLVNYEEDAQGIKLEFTVASPSPPARGVIAQEQGRSEGDPADEKAASSAGASEIVEADALIGADGINSVVRRLRDQKIGEPHNICPLKYVGVSVILGISTAVHPHINRRGFYVLDGRQRLFIMPFREAEDAVGAGAGLNAGSLGSAERYGGQQLTMWQLSFSDLTEAEALDVRIMSPEALLENAKQRTRGWLSPVADILAKTPLQEVWGTALFDRDPMVVYSKKNPGKGKPLFPRWETKVSVIGDAAHPMSMFKGQGANQALADGPLLAAWFTKTTLTTASIPTRLRCFEREMMARVTPKVLGSRQAAQHLHSPAVLQDMYGVQGVDAVPDNVCVLQALRNRNVGAGCGEAIDEQVGKVIKELLVDHT